MRKNLVIFLAFIAFAASASAQIYHYYTTNSTPWDGNKSYLLNVGTNFSLVARDFGPDASDVSINPGLALSFRYEGDKPINEHLSWGYQGELGYMTQGIKFDEVDSYSGKRYRSDLSWWDLLFTIRFSFSYWFNDNFELQAAAGLFMTPFYGYKGERCQISATGNEVSNTGMEEKGSHFGMGAGVSTMLQAKYFFNENFFVSLNLHDNIAFGSAFGKDFHDGEVFSKGGQRGIVMVGVGYKFIR